MFAGSGPVNPLVRELFEDSKADGSSSSSMIFDVLSPEHSSPLKVLDKLLETLDVASTHWRLLQRLGAWNTENQRKSSDLDSEDDGANLVSLGSLLQILEMEVQQGI